MKNCRTVIKILTLTFLCIQILESCQKNIQKTEIDNQEKKPTETKLAYYQNKYSEKESEIIILSVVENNNKEPIEFWSVDINEIEHISTKNISQINIEKIIRNARIHVKKRFGIEQLKLSDIVFENISKSKKKNLIAFVSFIKNEQGHTENVPVLLNGTIILSNRE